MFTIYYKFDVNVDEWTYLSVKDEYVCMYIWDNKGGYK